MLRRLAVQKRRVVTELLNEKSPAHSCTSGFLEARLQLHEEETRKNCKQSLNARLKNNPNERTTQKYPSPCQKSSSRAPPACSPPSAPDQAAQSAASARGSASPAHPPAH